MLEKLRATKLLFSAIISNRLRNAEIKIAPPAISQKKKQNRRTKESKEKGK